MTSEPCAQRSKLHVIAVQKPQVLVVPFGHGQRHALKVKAYLVLKKLDREASVVHVPAHSVVEEFGVFLMLKKADCMVHQPKAEPQRKYPYAEVCDRGLEPAAVFSFALVPLVEHQRAREHGHREVELLTERGVGGLVVAKDVERYTYIDRAVGFCELGGENGVVYPQRGLLLVPFIVAFAVSRIKPIKDKNAGSSFGAISQNLS